MPSLCGSMSTFSEESSDSVASSLHSAVLSLPQSLDDGASTLSEHHSLVTLAANPKGLQHRLSADISLLKAGVCLTAVTTRDTARIRSTQGRCAGARLDTVPTDEKYSLQPNEYRIASFLRLGLPLPFTDFLSECECRQQLDDSGYYLLTCKLGGGASVAT